MGYYYQLIKSLQQLYGSGGCCDLSLMIALNGICGWREESQIEIGRGLLWIIFFHKEMSCETEKLCTYMTTNFLKLFLSFIELTKNIILTDIMPRSAQIGQSISQQKIFLSSRDSLSVPCVSQPLHPHVSTNTTSEMDLSKSHDKKDRSKLKPGEQPLLGGSWNSAPRGSNAANTPGVQGAGVGTTASVNYLSSNNGNGCADR